MKKSLLTLLLCAFTLHAEHLIEIKASVRGIPLVVNDSRLQCSLCGEPATRMTVHTVSQKLSVGCDLHPQGEETPEANVIEKRKSPLFKDKAI